MRRGAAIGREKDKEEEEEEEEEGSSWLPWWVPS